MTGAEGVSETQSIDSRSTPLETSLTWLSWPVMVSLAHFLFLILCGSIVLSGY